MVEVNGYITSKSKHKIISTVADVTPASVMPRGKGGNLDTVGQPAHFVLSVEVTGRRAHDAELPYQ